MLNTGRNVWRYQRDNQKYEQFWLPSIEDTKGTIRSMNSFDYPVYSNSVVTIRSMNSFDYPVYSNSVVRSYWYITRHNVMMQSSHIMLWCNPILPVTIILYQSSNVRPKCWCLVCKRAFVTNYVDWPTSSLNVKWTEHFGFQWITNDTHSKCAGLGAAKYCILRPRNLTFSEHEALVYILS